MVTGQVVDTITNIKTVKLFAHAEHEDRAALDAMAGFRERALDFGVHLGLVPLHADDAGRGAAGAADRRHAPAVVDAARPRRATSPPPGAIAIRIAQMTGWVSFTLMSIYANVGEVEDGMHTLTPPHTLTDAADARDLGRVRGRDRASTTSASPTAARSAASKASTLTIRAGREAGHRRRLGGRANRRWSRCCCGSTTPKRGGS